jgi:parvulin-like peptidyl-prolyl isomerase
MNLTHRQLASLLLGCALAFPAAAAAQIGATDSRVVDRVAAVVGDSAILLTQVQERILQLGASGVPIPQDPAGLASLQSEVLISLVNEQLLIQAAVQDSMIVVDEEELDDMVQQEWGSRTAEFPGGQPAMIEALAEDGFTPASYREFLKAQLRMQRLQSQLIQRRSQSSRNITVSEEEVQEFFDQQQGQLPERPATVSFEQAIFQPIPSEEAKDSALALVQRILEMYRTGEEEFEDLARRFSDDPGSQRTGGDLGWFRRGGFVQEFEEAAYELLPGQISQPVETVYGYHLILVERIRGPERKARHILVAFDIGPEDLATSQQLAAATRTQVEGGLTLEAATEGIGPALALYDSATVATDQLANFPPAIGNALRVAVPGAVIGPVNAGGRPEAPSLAVVRVTAVREAGEATLEDLRDQIEARILQEKVLEEILSELRERIYVSVKI